MSVQRRRGQPCKVWPMIERLDHRGNPYMGVDLNGPAYEIRAAFIPGENTRAEVPGQQDIVVYKMICTEEMPGVGLWSRLFWRDRYWDVASPPQYHHGTRKTRHWSMDIRERPEVTSGQR